MWFLLGSEECWSCSVCAVKVKAVYLSITIAVNSHALCNASDQWKDWELKDHGYSVAFYQQPFNCLSESHSVKSNSLWLHGLNSPWNSLGLNTAVGSPSLLQGIFPTQGSNPSLLHCRQILYHLSHQGSPFKIRPLFQDNIKAKNWQV